MRIEEKFIEIKEEGKYYDRLEYLVCDSGKKGPKIFITSGAHGEEIGGMFVVYRLFERLKGTSLNNGAVYAILEPDSGDLMNNEAYKISEEKIYSTGLLVVREKEKIKGSLSLSLLEADISSATLELGESYVVNHNNVEYGVKSILNLTPYS